MPGKIVVAFFTDVYEHFHYDFGNFVVYLMTFFFNFLFH